MTMIQVRHVSAKTHRELKSRAAKAGMSLSDFLRLELDKMAARPSFEEALERLRRRPPTGITTEEIVRGIRADRESR